MPGIIGIIAVLIVLGLSLILSFGNAGEDESTRLLRLGWLVAGAAILWILARSDTVERAMSRIIEKALNRWTDLEIRDYTELLKLTGEYTVREIKLDSTDWLADNA